MIPSKDPVFQQLAIHHERMVGGELMAKDEGGYQISHHLSVSAMHIWGVVFQAETNTVRKCDRSSDKMIAGVMRECNEKAYNDDNTVSNERMEEQWR